MHVLSCRETTHLAFAIPAIVSIRSLSARMQANLVEIETDVVLMLVLPTGGSAPTSTKPFHTGGYPIRLSGLSRHSHQTKKEPRTLGWCPRLLAPLRCGIDRGNVPHTFILAEAALLAVVFRPPKREKCGHQRCSLGPGGSECRTVDVCVSPGSHGKTVSQPPVVRPSRSAAI